MQLTRQMQRVENLCAQLRSGVRLPKFYSMKLISYSRLFPASQLKLKGSD